MKGHLSKSCSVEWLKDQSLDPPFLIYINDLALICKHTMLLFFAEDSNLYLEGNNLNTIQDKLNEQLENISTWLKVSILSLNISKTQFMTFTKKNIKDEYNVLYAEDTEIEMVHVSKFLGIITDDKLSWRHHVAYISNKISKGIGLLIKTRK